LILAGQYRIPEVCRLIKPANIVIFDSLQVTIYFRNRLYRGNRVTKTDCEGLNAFESHNFPTLAEFRTKIQGKQKPFEIKFIVQMIDLVKWDLIFDRSTDGPFNVHTNLNRNVSLLRLFPGITYLTMRQFLEPPIQGVVLQTYGAGNLPTNRPDLIEELHKAIERGVLVVNCTQCAKGCVSYVYEGATDLKRIGVFSGSDMTIEAALMKVIEIDL
jgi:lysophospholipase